MSYRQTVLDAVAARAAAYRALIPTQTVSSIAAASPAPGEVILVQDGTYTDDVFDSLTVSGASGNPVIWVAETPGGVKLRRTATGRTWQTSGTVAYNVWVGFNSDGEQSYGAGANRIDFHINGEANGNFQSCEWIDCRFHRAKNYHGTRLANNPSTHSNKLLSCLFDTAGVALDPNFGELLEFGGDDSILAGCTFSRWTHNAFSLGHINSTTRRLRILANTLTGLWGDASYADDPALSEYSRSSYAYRHFGCKGTVLDCVIAGNQITDSREQQTNDPSLVKLRGRRMQFYFNTLANSHGNANALDVQPINDALDASEIAIHHNSANDVEAGLVGLYTPVSGWSGVTLGPVSVRNNSIKQWGKRTSPRFYQDYLYYQNTTTSPQGNYISGQSFAGNLAASNEQGRRSVYHRTDDSRTLDWYEVNRVAYYYSNINGEPSHSAAAKQYDDFKPLSAGPEIGSAIEVARLTVAANLSATITVDQGWAGWGDGLDASIAPGLPLDINGTITRIVSVSGDTWTLADAVSGAINDGVYVLGRTIGAMAETADVPGPSEGKTYQQQVGQPLCMRAANNVRTVAAAGHDWTPVSSIPGYLGDHAMQAEPVTPQLLIADPNTTPSPRMDFSANFVETGTHYVWLRGIQPGGDSKRDSCHVGINGVSPTLGIAARILPGGTWQWSGEQFSTGLRLEVEVPTTGPHTINVWMRENGTPICSIVLSTSVDFVPTDATPESGVAIEITDVRLSDITQNGATINATFQGEAENVIPAGFSVELQGVGVLPGLPYVDSSQSDTAAPDAPVLSAQLDADGDTVHLTATLVADNAPDYSATIRGRDTDGNTGQWVTSDTVALLPSGLDKYNFERRENGSEWVPLVSVSPTDPTLVDDTDPWAGVIEHRVFAVDLQANQTGSNETQIVEGQVTTTTVDTITDNSFVVHVQTLAGFDVIPAGETVEVMVTDAQGVETTYTPGSLPLTVTDYSDDVAPSAPAVTLIGSGATVSIIANAGEDLGAFVSVKARETVTQVWADWSPTVPVQMASSGFVAMYLEYQINQGAWNPADIIGTSDPFIWSQTIESNQVITVRVRQEDGAGNLSDWSAEKSYTYTTQVGEIVMHAPALINPDNVV